MQRISPETFVLLITAYATVENAVEAFQRGAHDYLMKPILLDEVLGKIRRLLAYRDAVPREPVAAPRAEPRPPDREQIVGNSPAMQQVFEMVRKVAPTPLDGAARRRERHRQGADRPRHPRAQGRRSPASARFLAVNCAAIPHDLLENQLFGHRKGAFTGADRDQAGVFVHAGTGTVFLDEIGELPLATQAKLLRAIEQKEMLPVGANEPVRVEARVLAATNKDLLKEVEAGPLPRGPVLSAQRGVHPPAAAARTARGHSRPGRVSCWPGTRGRWASASAA